MVIYFGLTRQSLISPIRFKHYMPIYTDEMVSLKLF